MKEEVEKPKEEKPKEAEKPPVAQALSEEDKQKLLQMSEISLWIDNYDDIFSDFDSRPYSQRALSDDFLLEAKKVAKGKASGKIELKFLVPQNQRDSNQEAVIKKRLREHFKNHFIMLKKEVKEMIRNGLLFALGGVALMCIASFFLFYYHERSFFINFLVVLLEPAGWFLFWEGLRHVIFESKEKKPNMEFYEKMSKCEIQFMSY